MTEIVYAKQQFKRSILAVLIGPIIGLVIGGVLGAIYAYVVHLNPFIYIGFIAAFVAGTLLTFGAKGAVNMLGATDRMTIFVASLIGVAGFVWVYYSLWLHLEGIAPWSTTQIQDLYLLGVIEPIQFTFERIAPQTSYSVSRGFGGNGVNSGDGYALYIWLVELALIAGPTVIMAFTWEGEFINPKTGGKMQPVGSPSLLAKIDLMDEGDVKAAVARRDFSALRALDPENQTKLDEGKASKGDTIPASALSFHQDPKDPDVYSLKVATGVLTYDPEDGWESEFDGTVINHLLITRKEFEALNKEFA